MEAEAQLLRGDGGIRPGRRVRPGVNDATHRQLCRRVVQQAPVVVGIVRVDLVPAVGRPLPPDAWPYRHDAGIRPRLPDLGTQLRVVEHEHGPVSACGCAGLRQCSGLPHRPEHHGLVARGVRNGAVPGRAAYRSHGEAADAGGHPAAVVGEREIEHVELSGSGPRRHVDPTGGGQPTAGGRHLLDDVRDARRLRRSVQAEADQSLKRAVQQGGMHLIVPGSTSGTGLLGKLEPREHLALARPHVVEDAQPGTVPQPVPGERPVAGFRVHRRAAGDRQRGYVEPVRFRAAVSDQPTPGVDGASRARHRVPDA